MSSHGGGAVTTLSAGKQGLEHWAPLRQQDARRRDRDKKPRLGDGQARERGSSSPRPPSWPRAHPAPPPPRGPRRSPRSPGVARQRAADPERRATKTGRARPRPSACAPSRASAGTPPCSQAANQHAPCSSHRLPSVAARPAEPRSPGQGDRRGGRRSQSRVSREGRASRLGRLLPGPSPSATQQNWCHITPHSPHFQFSRRVLRFSCNSHAFPGSLAVNAWMNGLNKKCAYIALPYAYYGAFPQLYA